MEFLSDVKLIQGGMGVYVSNWRLAKTVAMARPGVTAGTVSGTALDVVYTRLLQLGDPGGHARRALHALDETYGITIGRTICDRYFVEGGKAPDDRFRSTPMHMVRAQDGQSAFPIAEGEAPPVALKLDDEIIDLLIATGFAEVWLAKEGHEGKVFMNFLKKIEMPLIYILYGAMLAGVDGIVVGAGNPGNLPALCSQLAAHEAISHEVPVLYRESGERFVIDFDPKQIAGGQIAKHKLDRPAFLAIVSLEDLVTVLGSEEVPPDGFIIEHHRAGGHNAKPVGPMRRDELGQPIYGPGDEADLAAIRAVGIPFWLAGGYGSQDGVQAALAAGANGVQVGTLFALTEESGMKPEFRASILTAIKEGSDDEELVHTTVFSPTGFPFKVVQLPGTLADDEVFAERRRICDIGVLQQAGFSKPDEQGQRTLFQRCPAGPIEAYVGKRGLARNAGEPRCLCNGLLACVGLGQVKKIQGEFVEEPAIVTLGNYLDGVRRLSRQGQTHYFVEDVVADILPSQVAERVPASNGSDPFARQE